VLPYLAAVATYRLKWGIYFSGMAYKLLNDAQAFVSATNIGAGYNLKISKKLSADLSYSHSFYPTYSPFLQAANPDNANVELSYENWLTTTASVDYAFWKTTDIFLKLGMSKMISLGSIGKKDIVTLTRHLISLGGPSGFIRPIKPRKDLQIAYWAFCSCNYFSLIGIIVCMPAVLVGG